MIRSKSGAAIDGVICFGGEDWWYHNHGHYDLQMMREFSQKLPVLYVNSIGMRGPKIAEGAMFFKRLHRKFKSLLRGLVKIRENFFVSSPITLPAGGDGKFSAWISRKALAIQVKMAARKCNIKNPLVWVACPPGVTILDELKPELTVYQRTDRFEDYKDVDPVKIKSFDKQLKQKSDIVLFCARELFEAEKNENSCSVFVDHGVDFDVFEKAGIDADNGLGEPEDMVSIKGPRVGFIGGIDSHTFDPDLFVDVVKKLPDVSFVLIGACSLAEDWCPYDNVYQLGRRPYEEVASYMAACDVLIMPWNDSDWIKACNPVKMKEYLAVGRPVVSTYFPEIEYFRDHIAVAKDSDDFASLIKDNLENRGDKISRRERVRNHTWNAKANEVWKEL
ncbi:glycosyltransferase [Sneathiella marina]|uniref:Glycosyltransferase n=1 Tax=Sneathiella marina TaxID=2950108 RepID=A0ABY4W2C0_9PROT|nr:glycosyltransferase [Sneathiella marina]USG61303.1 glycosyltransferase [Sneathiella marina]